MSCIRVVKCMALTALGVLCTQSLVKADIVSTIENASSGSTVKCSGTYTVSEEIKVPSGVTVEGPATFVWTTGYNTDAGFYFDGGSDQKIESINVTGTNHGIEMNSNGGQAIDCNTYGNYNTGIQVEDSSGENSTISGCNSYDNCDKQTGGGNADGIDVKSGSGSGNSVSSCTVYDNSDDGFDSEKASDPVTYSNCTSHNNGEYDGYQGNGNGFKMGIGGDDIAHTYNSCTAYDNTAGNSPHGFSTNGNTGKIKLNECHSYSNTDKDVLGNCVLTDCTMQTSGGD
jgi:parallel beta helix pectate lyase-like protein